MIRLPREIVVFDTEYTTWEGSLERKWNGPNERREVVQIGAVKVNTRAFEEIEAYNILIRPVKNPVLSAYFIELTGITQEMIARKGVSFSEGVVRFAEWCGGLSLYAWGGDCAVFKENCQWARVPFPFTQGVCGDIRPLFEARGINVEQYMSSTIVRAFGVEPDVRAHDGLNDARQIVRALRLLSESFNNNGETN